MSFWENASPIVKGTIVFGVVALVLLIALNVMGGGGEETTLERSVTAGSE